MSVEENKKLYIQSVSFETFLKIVNGTDLVDMLYLYNMPNHIKSYAKDVENTAQSIFSIYENEDELWRVKKYRGMDIEVDDKSLKFQNSTIVDAELVLCLPIINSIIIVPGPESIKLGWDVTKILQLTNLVSLTPMLLRMTDVLDEDNPPNHKISISYEVIEKSPNS